MTNIEYARGITLSWLQNNLKGERQQLVEKEYINGWEKLGRVVRRSAMEGAKLYGLLENKSQSKMSKTQVD